MEKTSRDLALVWFEANRLEIERFASLRGRFMKRDDREEVIAETIAYAWRWALRAASLNKLDRLSPRMISLFASRLYRSGRRFAGGSNWRKAAAKEVPYSPIMDERTGLSTLADSLASHRRFQPEEIARVEMDYSLAASRMTARERELWTALVIDHEHGAQIRIAGEMKLCPARVTQLKAQIGIKLEKIGYGPGK